VLFISNNQTEGNISFCNAILTTFSSRYSFCNGKLDLALIYILITFYLCSIKIKGFDNNNSCHINDLTNSKTLLIRTYRFYNLVFIAINEYAAEVAKKLYIFIIICIINLLIE